MHFIRNHLSAGLLGGAAILSGTAGQGIAQESPAAGLAESLGLPMAPAKIHFWNAATQTTGALTCDIAARDHVHCTLDASSAQAQIDYAYSFDLKQASGQTSVTATLDRVRSWDGVDYRTGTDYTNFYQDAVQNEWAAHNPLARTSPDGMVVQNNVKMVQAQEDIVKIMSVAPVSDRFGLRITNIFEPAGNTVQAVILPDFAGAALTAAPQPAIRYGFSDGDQTVFDSHQAIAATGGGTGYKASVSQPPM